MLCTLAPHLPPDLIHEALEITREIDDLDHQATALAGLAPYLPKSLLSKALKVVRKGYGASAHARALTALTPYLPLELIPEAVEIAQAIYDPCYHTVALIAFPHYGQPEERLAMMRRALNAAREASDLEDRAKVVAMLAPYLPPELLSEAVRTARTIGEGQAYDVLYRTKALVALAQRYLPPELQTEVMAEVRKWLASDFISRADVLAALAPRLPQDLMPAALETAREIIQEVYDYNEMARDYPADEVPQALVALAPYLPRDLMPEALAAVSEIKGGSARGYALAKLAPYLPQELLPKALQAAKQIETRFSRYRAIALAALSEYGAPTALDEALRAVQEVQEANESVVVLPMLLAAGASAFPPEQRPAVLDEALRAAREIYDARYRAEALIRVTKYLTPETRQAVLVEAVEVAHEVQEPMDHTRVLGELVPHLLPEQRPGVVAEALKVAQEIGFGEGTNNHNITLAVVLPPLAAYLSPELLEEALKATRAVAKPAIRGRALALLAPNLPPDQCLKVLDESLKAARKIKDKEHAHRFDVLAEIALHVPNDQRRAVLVETLEAGKKVSGVYRSELGPTLAKLAPLLPPDLCSSALALAREIWSAYALAAFVPYVSAEERQDVLDEALAAAQGIKSAVERASVLATLVPQLQPDRRLGVLKAALAAVQQIDFPVNRMSFVQALASLASVWVQLPQQQAYDLWEPTLHAYAMYRRTYFLAALSALIPVIVAVGGTAALTETMRAVLEICRQWSWVYSGPQHNNQTVAKGE